MNKLKGKYYVFNETRMCFLSLGVTTADTHFARLRGLLGRIRLANDDGLWVIPSQGIHTFGMLFPIDVIYLDSHYRVIHCIEHLGTFRITPIRIQSESVLELPPRTIYGTGTQAGDQLLICSPEEMHNYWKTDVRRRGPGPGDRVGFERSAEKCVAP
jgi:uncharacterized membrane protein (UPF0127 family)